MHVSRLIRRSLEKIREEIAAEEDLGATAKRAALTELETDRLHLRAWLAERRRRAVPRSYCRTSGSTGTRRDARSRVEETRAQLARYRAHSDEHGFGLWALDVAGERAAGRERAGLSWHRLWPSEPELAAGCSTSARVRSRGYATEAGADRAAVRVRDPGVVRVVSIVHPENEPAFRRRAVALGSGPWRDVAWDDTGITLAVWVIERRWADELSGLSSPSGTPARAGFSSWRAARPGAAGASR